MLGVWKRKDSRLDCRITMLGFWKGEEELHRKRRERGGMGLYMRIWV